MLELLRKAAKTWVAKALLILLVASFGIWGVHSSMFSGANDAVVTVGDQKVSNSEFQFVFNGVYSQMQRSIPGLTLEQAKLFGLESTVFGQLASAAALDQLASDMKLGMSETRLLQLIQEEPAFKDPSGAFSRQLMERRLYDARIRTEDYIKNKEREAVRVQIADAVSNGFTPPATLTKALEDFSNERRTIDYLILTNANIDPIGAPTDAALAKWFEDNKGKYRAPEYRKITYVKLEPSDIADATAVTDEDVKADYDKHIDAYRTAETRTVEQLTFASKAEADAAAAKLAAGTTFDQLVAEQGKTATDVLLGDFTKDKLPTPAMADAAFAVKTEGGVTPVTDGLLGPVILRVTNIKPEVVKPLDAVKDDIRKQLALVRANDEIQGVHDRFEDTRASGASLAESASQLQLKSVTIDAVDATGRDPSEKEVANLPEQARLLTEAFKTDEGVEPLPLDLANGGYVWFEVNGVTPDRDRKLEEVRAKVVADWTREQQQLALAKKAEEISKQVRDGAKIADVAATLKIAVESKADIKRGMDDAVLGAAAINAAFGGPEGFVTAAAGADGQSQIVLKVTDVQNTPPTDALENNSEQIKQAAARAGDDFLDQLVSELQAEYGVSVNRTLANQLMVR
ncbi:peptidylprolyl isomerase [Rhizobium sp. FKL33]|uniref:peptidylprolyl isomerase n=1 Tax=Rhizobium sp. FKL33 TaxID=2562307 RepID=UPI0010C139BF|nr:peptidylprolyl isomerase [Rhizobium sp. FKL33]